MTHAQRHAGFTILELMITVSILAILLGIGVPAFNDIIRKNRLANETNKLVKALNLARLESAKRGVPVAVCPAALNADPNAAPSCAVGATNWANGWLVFTDRIGTVGVYDNANPSQNDELLQVDSAPTMGFSVVSDSATPPRFTPSTRNVASTPTFTIRPVSAQECAKAEGPKLVRILPVGRVEVGKGTSCS